MEPIDLKIKREGKPEPIGMPDYPTFSFTSQEDHGLPDEGELTVKFKKVSSTEEKNGGKTSYRCTVEVQKILDVEEESASEDNTEGGETDETDTGEAETPAPKKKRSAAVAAVLGNSDEGESAGY